MDDELTHPARDDRVAARTSERVAEMSEEARAELARELAGRTGTVPGAPFRKAATVPHTPTRRAATPADQGAAAVLAAELRRTERRLDRLEASFSHGRYQTGSAAAPRGRYARLLSRANRLERELRALR